MKNEEANTLEQGQKVWVTAYGCHRARVVRRVAPDYPAWVCDVETLGRIAVANSSIHLTTKETLAVLDDQIAALMWKRTMINTQQFKLEDLP